MSKPISPRHALGLVALLTAAAFGCSSKTAVAPVTPAAPNPFLSADRVPPPGGVGVAPPATTAPYYQGAPATFAPDAAPAVAPGAVPASPSVPFSNPAPVQGPPPGSAAPVYNAPQSFGAATPSSAPLAANGDRVAIPGDGGSLRFGSTPASISAPVTRSNPQQLAAAPSPARPPATANGWIAGSAPIRPPASSVAGSGTRVRMPSGQVTSEPVSLAALDGTTGSVAITPLEPAPLPSGSAQPGEAAPLRVASPSTTGWR